MPLKTNARGTNNIQTKKIVVDMSERISMLNPNAAPLMVLSKKIGTEETHNTRFSWLEDDILGCWTTNTVAVADGVPTSITVADSSVCAVDDLVKNPVTGEVVLVTAIPDATHLTVVRGYGETAAAAITINSKLMVIGNASMQGDGAPAEKYNIESEGYNYTQIIKNTFSVTNTLQSVTLYGGAELTRLRIKKGIEHSRSIENMLWFGERKNDLTGAQPRTTSAGVVKFLQGTSNVLSKTKTNWTDDALMDYFETLFTYGSDTKIGFASPGWISLINKMARTNNKIQLENVATQYGINIMKYITPHGILALVKNPLFVQGYSGYCAILDMEQIKYRPLKGRDTKLKSNIQNNDEDGVKDMFITEAGLELRQPIKHGIMIATDM